jgi:cystathionine beta-lyase
VSEPVIPSLEVLRTRTSEKWATHPPEILPAFIAEMDFDVAEPVRRAAVEVIERSDLGYPRPYGLGEAFAEFARASWDFAVDPARVHAAPDVMTGVATMMAACTPPGSGVVVNPPVYPPFLFRTEQTERRLAPVPLTEDFGLDLDALDAALARPDVSSYLLCSPHNPLGRVWSRDELLAVAELCWKHEVMLLVDEIHAPLTLDGAEFVPFGSVDHPMVERSFAFHSASKAWNIPGLKCGLIIAGSPSLSATVRQRWEALIPSQPGVFATVAAYRDPEARAWLRAVVHQLEQNRKLLTTLLAEHLPALRWTVPQASYLVWLDCRALGLGDDPAAAFYERGRVALVPGRHFGTNGEGHARLNIGTSPEILGEIVRRMASVADR